MITDVVEYYSPTGIQIGLCGVYTDRWVNVRDARLFAFSTDIKTSVIGERTFNLDVVCINKSTANWIVSNIVADGQGDKLGRLVINDFTLMCRCIGVSAIKYDKNAYSFTLSFYSPRYIWAQAQYYKYQSGKFYKRVNNQWSSTGTITIDVDDGQFAVSVYGYEPFTPYKPVISRTQVGTINGTFSFDCLVYDLNSNETDSNTHSITVDEATSLSADYLERTIKGNYDDNIIDSVPDTSDWFHTYPFARTFRVRNVQGSVSGYLIFIVHRLRGAPYWQ